MNSDTNALEMASPVGDPGPAERAPPALTFESMGLKKSPSQESLRGKIRKFFNERSLLELVFFAFGVLFIAAALALTIFRLTRVGHTHPDFFFGFILLVQLGFCSYYLVYGFWQQRFSAIAILLLAMIALVSYLIANYIHGPQTTVKLVRMIVTCVASVALLAMGFQVIHGYFSANKTIVTQLGANRDMQRLKLLDICFHDLLIFDLQLFVTLLILLMVDGFNKKQIILLAVGVLVVFVRCTVDCLPKLTERRIKITIAIGLVFCVVDLVFSGLKLDEAIRNLGDDDKGLPAASIACFILEVSTKVVIVYLSYYFWRHGKTLIDKEQEHRDIAAGKKSVASQDDPPPRPPVA